MRLALEYAGVDYEDIALIDPEAVAYFLTDLEIKTPAFAPPYLRDGDIVIGQTALILHYLGPKLWLAPQDEAERLWLHQVQMTMGDFVGEVHDTHHPIGPELYYEDQKREAERRSASFREHRMPKYLGWFERVLRRNPHGPTFLVGDSLTYADLSLFHILAGLDYAFPRAFASLIGEYPCVQELGEYVADQPELSAYLESDRRLPFNETGIFRHYPELDD
ncbi:glutathione S-transferase [Oricola sp.]|uniref:glutathione S-transferase n=1 Tax=Oricola sp. TaxID=1979950 RepID=UPI0025FD0452|nr:glutathione S-transferase [Oricola sp.]MCI5078326.1 glutathione S-transferase [Oricola sp.]